MAKYKLVEGGVMDTDHMRFIPSGSTGRFAMEFEKWKDDGNVPDPEDTYVDTPEDQLQFSDLKMIRAVDWLLQKLIQNGTISLSEIPPGLQALYQERKAQRGQ